MLMFFEYVVYVEMHMIKLHNEPMVQRENMSAVHAGTKQWSKIIKKHSQLHIQTQYQHLALLASMKVYAPFIALCLSFCYVMLFLFYFL